MNGAFKFHGRPSAGACVSRLVFLSLLAGVLHTAHADKVYFSPEDAASYARERYATSYGSSSRRNPFTDYGSNVSLGGNCTNFGSQCILAGLIGSISMRTIYDGRKDYKVDRGAKGSAPLWYFVSDRDRGDAWTGADRLAEYSKAKRGVRALRLFRMGIFDEKDLTPMLGIGRGDLIIADFNNDGRYDHTMVVDERTRDLPTEPKHVYLSYQSTGAPTSGTSKKLSVVIRGNPGAKYLLVRPLYYSQ